MHAHARAAAARVPHDAPRDRSQFNGGVLLGISASMWLEEHNMHHAYTLRPHADPQFTYFPLWLQSSKEVPQWLAALPSHPAARRLVWGLTRGLNSVRPSSDPPLAAAATSLAAGPPAPSPPPHLRHLSSFL
eukprot:7140359-Prymnesium_polylepis.1